MARQTLSDDAESLRLRVRLDLGAYQRLDAFPSPFQQLVWSWCQFLPVALALFAAGYYALACCFEYDVLESRTRYSV